MCSSSRSKPASLRAAAPRARTRRAPGPCRRGPSRAARASRARTGSADGAERLPRARRASGSSPSHGQRARALAARVRELHADLRARAARARSRRCASTPRACASFHIPVQPGVMRRVGARRRGISAITRPAPPTARLPRCTRCQSFGTPSSPEYWHIGETTMRFASVQVAQRNGWNSGANTRRRRRGPSDAAPARRVRLEPRTARSRARTSSGSRCAQVVVRDALAARHQVERELQRVLAARSAREFSNHSRLVCAARCSLRTSACARPRRRRAPRGTSLVPVRARTRRQRDRVLHRQLGARADREVRRVRRVADAAPRCRGASARCGRSGTSRQIERFVSSRCPSRSSREQLLAERDASRPRSARSSPARFQVSSRHSTMNVRGPLVERVRVHLEQRRARSRLKTNVNASRRRSVPSHVNLQRAPVDGRLEVRRVAARARALLTPSAREDQVGVRQAVAASTSRLEAQLARRARGSAPAGSRSSSRARRCRRSRGRSSVMRSPRKNVSMSSQYAKRRGSRA